MKRAILFFNLVCAVTLIVSAQTEPHVGMLNKYIAFMADPQNDSDTRFYYKEEAQKLFVNNCNPYTEIVEFEDGTKETIRRESVTMQVVSLRNRTPRTKPMKDYFRGLIKMNYRYVKIESADIVDMRVSKLQPYGKDADGKQLYVCSVFFDQVFVGVTPEGESIKISLISGLFAMFKLMKSMIQKQEILIKSTWLG